MGDFFKGWRRKVGCVTLVMACVMAAIWVRSFVIIDAVDLYPGSFTHHTWGSRQGIFSWSGREHGRIIPRRNQWRFTWENRPILPDEDWEVGRSPRSGWAWHVLGAYFRRQHDPEVIECEFRYGFVVAPLTLLSAYLILWKPRKRRA